MPAQEPVLSSPSPHRSTLSLGIYLTGSNTVRALPLFHIPLPFFGRRYRRREPRRRLRLDHAITLTSFPLAPHAEPPLVIDHEGEAVPDQSEQSESFELVSPPSISALNGGGGNDHIDANAWWSDFTRPDPAVLSVATCTLELEQGQRQEQEQLLVVNLSDATSLQVQTEPLDGHLQIDCDTRRSG